MTTTTSETAPADEQTRFSARLRDATSTAHRDAERSAFVHRLFRGQLPLDGLADLTAQLWFVYGALERTGTALGTDPVATSFARPELERRPALESDLAALSGPDWRERVRPLPETQAYVAAIDATVEDPHRFVAHHYTRLLGDLSGGQMIRRTIERHYGEQVDGALSFYDMSHLGDLDAYKDAYRARLDAAPWSEVEREQVIAEANGAFAANAAVFSGLGAAHPDPMD